MVINMKYMALLAIMIAFQATLAKDEINPDGIMQSAYLECQNLGGEAKAIQMIRGDDHPTLEQILVNLETYIADEFPDGQKKQPLFIARIREVGKWVFYHFESDFDPELVGTTYETECTDKTMKQIVTMFPNIEGGKMDQKMKAWESTR